MEESKHIIWDRTWVVLDAKLRPFRSNKASMRRSLTNIVFGLVKYYSNYGRSTWLNFAGPSWGKHDARFLEIWLKAFPHFKSM